MPYHASYVDLAVECDADRKEPAASRLISIRAIRRVSRVASAKTAGNRIAIVYGFLLR